MRRMLISRVSRRVLAEHHLALSDVYSGRTKEATGEPHVGIIFTGLDVKRSIEKCSRLLRERPFGFEDDIDTPDPHNRKWPEVMIEGHLDTKFSYIKEHLECDQI